ncbi:hypothetical protein [Chryseobacterium gambrini]|uniref:Uncharacterized protein n=1 Tax=Chryseobacterium gambrini TaxID=373672 RepID=A0ABM8K622_9FLAO|nr:hypothetical protein CRDW_18440 [Chryseobacterium gambrini]
MSIRNLENRVIIQASNYKIQKLYPATVIGAQFSYFKKIDKSGPIDSLKIVKKLRNKLISIGELYSKQNGNTIGCCAEVNVSNQILIKRPNIELSKIKFTKAIRPRTMQEVPRCKNCKLTFE